MNAQSPIIFLVFNVLLANRIPLLLQRKSYPDFGRTSTNSEIYLGANPLITLKVISKI